MNEDHVYIEQQNTGDVLYSKLQRKTLEELQRLSGKVWTNFNPHDPGVTIADIANYALAELNYKLGFDLQDYLTEEKAEFSPELYGLFFPEKMYPTHPVTTEDYRKLLYANFPTLGNIQIDCDVSTGEYSIQVERSSFGEPSDIEDKIRACFHEHRNLCENLKKITLHDPVPLTLHSELEINPGEDATAILAQIYWTIIRYLSGSMRIEKPEMFLFSALSPEEWLDGPTENMRVIIPEQRNTEYELYQKLTRIGGIKAFKTCYLLDEDKSIITDFSEGYRIVIPKRREDFHIKITIGSSRMPVDEKKFIESLQALYFSGTSPQFSSDAKKKKESQMAIHRFVPSGVYRNVFTHYSIKNDFPACFMVDEQKMPDTASDHDKKRVTQLAAYLGLFDLLLQRGLTELEELKNLLSIADAPDAILSEMRILSAADGISDGCRNVCAVKHHFLDFLDHLYGEESYPVWMSEFSFYGETVNDVLKRRMAFLRHIPVLAQNRSGARNIYGEVSADNIPAIKAYLSFLLGLKTDETSPVGNILPSHNLVLMGDDKELKQFREWISSMMIDENGMDNANILSVEMIEDSDKFESVWASYTKEQKAELYETMRRELLAFNSNMINGGLFRGGINLQNYKIAVMQGGNYLLMFQDCEDGVSFNLGHTGDRDGLEKQARILRHYLQELNSLCEGMYVIEQNLLPGGKKFTVSFVFPEWTARFKMPRFREICKQQILSLLPAHLKAEIHWLDVLQMQHFEENYQKWCKSLPLGGSTEYSNNLLKILQDAGMKAKKQ